MGRLLTRFAKDQRGATAMEYGLIAALIAAVIITVMSGAGGSLKDLYQTTFEVIAAAL